MMGIYKITNQVNGKVYIGQSTGIIGRWKNHLKIYNNSNYSLYKRSLYEEMREYGLENFNFSIIELCNKEELDTREEYWINFYESNIKGYNDSNYSECYQKLSEEQVNRIRHLLKTSDIPVSSIAKTYEVSSSTISDINMGRTWYNENIVYPIRVKILNSMKLRDKKCPNCGALILRESQYCEKCSHVFARTVERPGRDELKKLIRTRPFTQIGKMYGVSDNAVRKWCDFEGLPRKKVEIKKYTDEEWALI